VETGVSEGLTTTGVAVAVNPFWLKNWDTPYVDMDITATAEQQTQISEMTRQLRIM
jgi:hypothetical protein